MLARGITIDELRSKLKICPYTVSAGWTPSQPLPNSHQPVVAMLRRYSLLPQQQRNKFLGLVRGNSCSFFLITIPTGHCSRAE
jgi:hypothetical protein